MATITGLTAARMLDIEAASVVDGAVVGNNLILTKHDGTTIDAGPVVGPAGPTGPQGPTSVGGIPGEVRLWSGGTLPAQGTYGKWVWADGAVYPNATYPAAAANIGSQWRTFAGASDPGGTNFRVPDLRGLVPAGMDAMPGGARANRMTRASAIVLAAKVGEEQHQLSVTEMPQHQHGGSVSTSISFSNIAINVSGGISGTATDAGSHAHQLPQYQANSPAGKGLTGTSPQYTDNIQNKPGTGGTLFYINTDGAGSHTHPLSGSFSGSGSGGTGSGTGSGTIPLEGGNASHENVQPTVFVPYIVFLG